MVTLPIRLIEPVTTLNHASSTSYITFHVFIMAEARDFRLGV